MGFRPNALGITHGHVSRTMASALTRPIRRDSGPDIASRSDQQTKVPTVSQWPVRGSIAQESRDFWVPYRQRDVVCQPLHARHLYTLSLRRGRCFAAERHAPSSE